MSVQVALPEILCDIIIYITISVRSSNVHFFTSILPPSFPLEMGTGLVSTPAFCGPLVCIGLDYDNPPSRPPVPGGTGVVDISVINGETDGVRGVVGSQKGWVEDKNKVRKKN